MSIDDVDEHLGCLNWPNCDTEGCGTEDADDLRSKMKSIDDITPEEWDSFRVKEAGKDNKFQVQWLDDEENIPNEHPVYNENPLGKTYSKLINNMVDHPPHYNNGKVECIEAIEAMLTPDEFVGYLRGNSLKYRWRFRYKKKPIEDLRKARWYEERLLKFLMENQDVLG